MKRPNDAGAHTQELGTQCRQNTPLRAGCRPCRRIANVAGRHCGASRGVSHTFIVCACLTGCSFLKPAPDTSRHFVLTPLPATEMANVTLGASRVGVVRVKIPAYLFNSSLAVRKGANEIVYPPDTLWAERLDTVIPRVLAADLSSLLPTDKIRMSVEPSDDLATKIGVTIEQFDVSSSGQAVLVAGWRISRPGEKRLCVPAKAISRVVVRHPTPTPLAPSAP